MKKTYITPLVEFEFCEDLCGTTIITDSTGKVIGKREDDIVIPDGTDIPETGEEDEEPE